MPNRFLAKDRSREIFLVALIFLIYWRVFSSAFGPEDPYHYDLNVGWSWAKTMGSYLSFSEEWYRPTSLHFMFKVVTQFFSWHDFAWLRLLNLLSFGAAVVFIYRLGRWCTPESKGGPFLGALYFATLPTLLLVIHHVNSFDFLYQCWLLAAALLFLRFDEGTASNPRAAYWGSWLCFLVALSSKEQAMAFPAFLFLYAAANPKTRWQPFRYVRLLPFCLASGALVVARLTRFRADNSDYRTVFHLSTVTKNLRFYSAWLFRWQEKEQHFLVRSLDSPVEKVAALVLFSLAAVGFWRVWKTRQQRPGFFKLFRFAACWFAAFLILPLVCGGYPWHIGISAMAFALVWGYVVYEGCLTSFWPRAALILFLCGLANFAHHTWIFRGPFTGIYQMNDALINGRRPPALDRLGDKTIVLIKNDVKFTPGTYGVGSLFRYVFLKPNWQEATLDAAPPETLAAWLKLPDGVCVNWVPDRDRWEDTTAECREAALKKF